MSIQAGDFGIYVCMSILNSPIVPHPDTDTILKALGFKAMEITFPGKNKWVYQTKEARAEFWEIQETDLTRLGHFHYRFSVRTVESRIYSGIPWAYQSTYPIAVESVETFLSLAREFFYSEEHEYPF